MTIGPINTGGTPTPAPVAPSTPDLGNIVQQFGIDPTKLNIQGSGVKPNVVFNGKSISYDKASDYIKQLRTSKDPAYNQYVNTLKSLGYIKSKNPSNTAINNAWKTYLGDTTASGLDALTTMQEASGNASTTDNLSQYAANSAANLQRNIQRIAMQNGIQLTKEQISNLTGKAVAGGWDAATLKENVARAGTFTDQGEAGTIADALKSAANDYGVSYSDEFFAQAAQSVLEGKSTADIWKQQIKDVAKSRYAAFADQIESGVTPRQIASPYIQSMANILELNPQEVNLSDPTISKALTSLDAEGKPAPTALWQFEQGLRQDPRWRFTKNAQQDLMGTARKVLSDFGLVS